MYHVRGSEPGGLVTGVGQRMTKELDYAHSLFPSLINRGTKANRAGKRIAPVPHDRRRMETGVYTYIYG